MDLDSVQDVEHLIADLRERIDREYRKALRAHQCLAQHLLRSDPPGKFDLHLTAGESLREIDTYLKASLSSGAIVLSKRERVLSALSEDWLSIPEIAETAELTEKQTRGVLYSPEIKGKAVSHTNMHGAAKFRLKCSFLSG